MRVNLIGTYNVLEAAHATQSTLERLVDFSTSEVFGTRAYRVEETHVTSGGSVGEARWTYAVSKLAGEYMAHSYFDEFGLPATTVRPFNIYGPGQVGVGAIHTFTVRALAGDELVIHGDGSQIRAWCYIDDMVEAVLLVLESGHLTMGPKVPEFETLLADTCGTDHAVAVSSGTAALHVAVAGLGVGAEDEVIVPAYTFPATANAVVLAGARPVLVDVNPRTMNVDPARVYDAVTTRTRAVIAVHLFGRPLDWEALQSAVPPEVALIEDAAGALGARWRGMPCGGLGVMGCLSFHPRKVVTTGEGGAVTTSDADLVDLLRS